MKVEVPEILDQALPLPGSQPQFSSSVKWRHKDPPPYAAVGNRVRAWKCQEGWDTASSSLRFPIWGMGTLLVPPNEGKLSWKHFVTEPAQGDPILCSSGRFWWIPGPSI